MTRTVIRVDIFMKLISCFQDGQLKILMEVIGVGNSPPNVGEGK
jgi:hypothetical protein